MDIDNDARQAVYHALQSQVDLATAGHALEGNGLVDGVYAVEIQDEPRDIHDWMRQMRDVAAYEER